MNSAVLIVDDEHLIRETLSDLLSMAGLRTLQAGDSCEALEMLKTKAPEVGILVTDVRMPGSMDGLDLATTAQKSWPWIKVIVMSGHYDREPDRLPRNARFLAKPWHSHDVMEIVQGAAREFEATQTMAGFH